MHCFIFLTDTQHQKKSFGAKYTLNLLYSNIGLFNYIVTLTIKNFAFILLHFYLKNYVIFFHYIVVQGRPKQCKVLTNLILEPFILRNAYIKLIVVYDVCVGVGVLKES